MAKRFYTPGHFIRLVHSGSEYFDALCHLIDSARKTIHLQVYIFELDDTGQMVLGCLERAASRGVHIHFMADGYGSAALTSSFRYRMQKKGIRFRFFSPFHFPLPVNAGRRLHQKVCVADGQRALVGGINVSNRYHGNDKFKPWLDYALYIEGPLCVDLETMCKRIWRRRFSMKKEPFTKNSNLLSGGIMARMVMNDWLRSKNQISSSYKKRLGSAQHSIIIIASYFLPSRRLLNILLRSAKKGRSVSVILSKHSDVPFIKPAMAYLYNRLLKSGVKIFEYTESVLHAKAVVTDNRWLSIGSHNMNHLSEFISMEINVEVLDKNFGEAFSNELQLLMKYHCEEITLEDFTRKNSFPRKVAQWSSYKIVSWSQRLLSQVTGKIS